MADVDGIIRQLQSPLSGRDLRPLEPTIKVVQFDRPLRDEEYRSVAGLLRSRPDVDLRAYGDYRGRFTDLDFLAHFQGIGGLQIDLRHIEDVSGLVPLLPTLERFAWGATDKRFSLAPLEDARRLQSLHLEGHSKHIEVIGTLTQLERLSLRSITLASLKMFVPLRGLRKFELRLGGTADINDAAAFEKLQYLELWMVRGLSDLSVLAKLPSLEYLFLQTLKHAEKLPSLAPLTKLRRVVLQTMKGLSDLSPIAAAPALEHLVVIDMGQLPTDCLAPFVGHPTLKTASAGLGSLRRNSEAQARLPHVSSAPPPPFIFSSN